MVDRVEPQALSAKLQQSMKPCLVAFLKRNARFREQLLLMDELSGNFGSVLNCYVYDADYMMTAVESYRVTGTPTFILFSQGAEVKRLIGASDKETLDEFVRSNLGRL